MANFRDTNWNINKLSALIVKSINTLNEPDRQIFILKHYRNLRVSEISRRLRIPRPDVDQSLQNSSRKLMDLLRPYRRSHHI